MPTNPKVTSYIAKFAVHIALNAKTPSKEEIGSSIGLCLNHPWMRDKFVGVQKELEELGYKRVEVLNNALRFCKNDNIVNKVEFVPITFEPEISKEVKYF